MTENIIPFLLTVGLATIIIEFVVLLCLGERRWKVLLSSVPLNAVTNVLLNLTLNNLTYAGWEAVVVGELLVVVAEAGAYYLLVGQWKRAWVYSALCNAISFLLGLLVFLLFVLLLMGL